MSWKPEVQVAGAWSQNGLVFATEQEAAANASNLFSRWMQAEAHRAVESDKPINASYHNGRLTMLGEGSPQ